MEIQEILTYMTIAIAGIIVLFSLYRTLFPSKEKVNQHGCSSSCNCDAVKMRKELLSKKI
ncbi:MAG: hypothetical protein WCR72_10035 [Bacteroidota bacterium]